MNYKVFCISIAFCLCMFLHIAVLGLVEVLFSYQARDNA